MNRRATTDAGDRILSNLSDVVTGTEELLRATKHMSGEGLAAARARVEEQIDSLREVLDEAESFAREKTKAAVQGTDRYVHKNPWQAIGIAMAVGILLGFLSQRR